MIGSSFDGGSDRDLADEIAQHLEEKVDALVAAGMPREKPSAAARREFGNVTLIEERGPRRVALAGRRGRAWPTYATRVRQLRRSPSFAAAAILTLALGIGANTAVFSVVNALVLRPLPFPHADRLVSVAPSTCAARQTNVAVLLHVLRASRRADVFERISPLSRSPA